jgi:uncharacterized protein YjiK
MPPSLYFRPVGLALCAVVLLGLALLAQQQRLFERAWFDLGQRLGVPHDQALGLADYRATIQGKAIEGVSDDLSALTFDPTRGTLFTLTNQDSELIELSLDGQVLRRIDLQGFGDPEAVEYIRPGVFVISDEREHRLLAVQLDDHTTVLDAAQAERLLLSLGGKRNRSFEGLAYDTESGRLFVAQEQSPMLIYEISGFPRVAGRSPTVEIARNPQRDRRLFVEDLSSLHFDERSGHLLALSDQSRLLLELDRDGKPIGSLSLRRGFHGLDKDVPQAEGVTLDDEGNVYVVSEPNLFYAFKRH